MKVEFYFSTFYLLRTRRAGLGEAGDVNALLGIISQVESAVIGRQEISNVLVVDLQVGHGHLKVGQKELCIVGGVSRSCVNR